MDVRSGGRGKPHHEALSGTASPISDFLQSIAEDVFEEPNAMARVFELVDVGPYLSLPRTFVSRGFPARSATSVQLRRRGPGSGCLGQFDEDTPDFQDLFIGADDVFVAEQVAKAQFSGFAFGLRSSVEGSVFSAQLFGRVTRHPERFFVRH